MDDFQGLDGCCLSNPCLQTQTLLPHTRCPAAGRLAALRYLVAPGLKCTVHLRMHSDA
jgi:hypothetical protein